MRRKRRTLGSIDIPVFLIAVIVRRKRASFCTGMHMRVIGVFTFLSLTKLYIANTRCPWNRKYFLCGGEALLWWFPCGDKHLESLVVVILVADSGDCVTIKLNLVEEHVLPIKGASEDLLARVLLHPEFLAFAPRNVPLELLVWHNMLIEERASNLGISEEVHRERKKVSLV